MKLTKGQKYDTLSLVVSGWTDSDEHLGHCAWDYFSGDGTYLGPDPYGVEPYFDWITPDPQED